jgi:Nickel/cobalt transporter regulator
MKSLKISGLALLMAALPVTAQAGDSPGAVMGGMPPMSGGMPHMPSGGMPHVGMPHVGMPNMPRPNVGNPNVGGPRNWGGRNNGRWVGGWQAPGGWNAYRRPFVGYVLPSYWVNPSFYLGNYSTYGFSRPSGGYGWSRYYDDAVLTDRNGRVQDYVEGVSWDRYDRYDDAGGEDYSDSYGYRDEGGRGDGYDQDGRNYRGGNDRGGRDRDGGLGGALIGGAVGAVAGNIIGGRGNRLAGSLIGGGVGAIAGAAIDNGDSAGRGYKVKRPKFRREDDRQSGYDYDDRGSRSGGRAYEGEWNGQWTGRWNGGPTQTYEGRYEGDYRGEAPHWGGRGRGPAVVYHNPSAYGYHYGGGETTTIIVQQSQPVVTTTTTTSEQVIYASAPRRHYVARRVWKPRPKVRCLCR